jgi:Kelch motif
MNVTPSFASNCRAILTLLSTKHTLLLFSFGCSLLLIVAAQAEPGGTLIHPRLNHTATPLTNGQVLLAGGVVDASRTLSASCELYSRASNSWTATADMNVPRQLHGSLLLSDGRVLTMGGVFSGTNLTNSAEIYDPGMGSWTSTGSMETARSSFDPVLLPNGKVLVAGGAVAFPELDTAACELYDPATGTWSPTGSMLQSRTEYHATLLTDGRVLVAGGFSQAAGLIGETEIYDPATGTWSSSGSLNMPRTDNVQVRLADGRVLVAGGIKKFTFNTPKITASAEIFDPATGSWTRTGPLNTPRIRFTANLLDDGTVFAAGGSDGTLSGYSSIEVFAPSREKWRMLNTGLASTRYLHSATSLLDGSIIIAGGLASGGTVIPDADLFVTSR